MGLLHPQRSRRTDPRGSLRGTSAGQGHDADDDEGDAAESDRIHRSDAEEEARKEARQANGGDGADDQPDRGEAERLSEDEAKNVPAGGAERRANSDLARPLRHAVGDDAVDADRGE